MTITPFTITTSDAQIADLKERLAMTRFPSEVAASWDRGTPVAFVKSLVEEWASNYDWAATVARLNRLPNFTTTIDGLFRFENHSMPSTPLGPETYITA